MNVPIFRQFFNSNLVHISFYFKENLENERLNKSAYNIQESISKYLEPLVVRSQRGSQQKRTHFKNLEATLFHSMRSASVGSTRAEYRGCYKVPRDDNYYYRRNVEINLEMLDLTNPIVGDPSCFSENPKCKGRCYYWVVIDIISSSLT